MPTTPHFIPFGTFKHTQPRSQLRSVDDYSRYLSRRDPEHRMPRADADPYFMPVDVALRVLDRRQNGRG